MRTTGNQENEKEHSKAHQVRYAWAVIQTIQSGTDSQVKVTLITQILMYKHSAGKQECASETITGMSCSPRHSKFEKFHGLIFLNLTFSRTN